MFRIPAQRKSTLQVEFAYNGKITFAMVSEVNAKGEVVTTTVGRTECSEKDIYRKTIGQKTALTRALSSYSEALRTRVWKEYLARYKDAIGLENGQVRLG